MAKPSDARPGVAQLLARLGDVRAAREQLDPAKDVGRAGDVNRPFRLHELAGAQLAAG